MAFHRKQIFLSPCVNPKLYYAHVGSFAIGIFKMTPECEQNVNMEEYIQYILEYMYLCKYNDSNK